MICPLCNGENAEDAVYCAKCGKKIPRCPTCGFVLRGNRPFCPNDGTAIPPELLTVFSEQRKAEPEEVTGRPVESGKGGSKTWIVAICVMVLAAAIVVGAVTFFVKKGDKTDDTDVAEVTEELTEETETAEDTEEPDTEEPETEKVYTAQECEELVASLKETDSSSLGEKQLLLEMSKDVVASGVCSLDGSGVVLAGQEIPETGDMTNELFTGATRTDGEYILFSGPFFDTSYGNDDAWLKGYADILYRRDNAADYGFALLYARTYTEEKEISSVNTSSVLAPEYGKTYNGKNMIDDNFDTAWVEGVDGVGAGESITLYLEEPTEVYGVQIFNGYLASADLYDKNGKVNRVEVDFGYGETKTAQIPANSLTNSKGEIKKSEYSIGRVALEEPVVTDTITITILEAEAGYKYTDTCISEIKIY